MLITEDHKCPVETGGTDSCTTAGGVLEPVCYTLASCHGSKRCPSIPIVLYEMLRIWKFNGFLDSNCVITIAIFFEFSTGEENHQNKKKIFHTKLNFCEK